MTIRFVKLKAKIYGKKCAIYKDVITCHQLNSYFFASNFILKSPSSIVLTPKGGKKAQQTSVRESRISFTPDPDPDRLLTYIDEEKQLLYGKGLEERYDEDRRIVVFYL